MPEVFAIGHLVSAELLDALKRAFPSSRPRESDSDRRIWIRSGNQEVIEFLEFQRAEVIQQSMEPQ